MLAHLGLGGRGEDRLGQLLRVLQAGGQFDPAHLAGGLVILPAAAGEVAAHHGFDQDRLQALDHHGAALDLLHFLRRDHGFGRDAGLVVRHDVREFAEPEVRHLVQHAALVGDRLAHDDVERRQAVGGDDQQLVIADGVVVAHLAVAQQRQRVDGGLVESVGHDGSDKTAKPPGAGCVPRRPELQSAFPLRGRRTRDIYCTTCDSLPALYCCAMSVRPIGLILPAWPSQPKAM
ncbi:hypothetical protein D9M72_488630 [compost metagenome]